MHVPGEQECKQYNAELAAYFWEAEKEEAEEQGYTASSKMKRVSPAATNHRDELRPRAHWQA